MKHIIYSLFLSFTLLNASDLISDISNWNNALSSSDKEAKYCKMGASTFSFFRGTNHLFWKKFANDTRLNNFSNSKTKIWIQGDLHAYNYGAFDNDNAKVIYDLNDFDETVIADYQYDVWRMAISLVLIMNENDQNGVSSLSNNDKMDIVDAFSESYLDTVASYRGNDSEVSKKFTANNTYGRLDNFLNSVEDKESRKKMLNEWSDVVEEKRVFDFSNTDLNNVSSSIKTELTSALSNYGSSLSGSLPYDSFYFHVKDIAKRINAGTGSLGTPRYYILIEGETSNNNDDHILDVKLQTKPTPFYFIQDSLNENNHAKRHAIGYKALSKHTDDHLGWLTYSSQNYSVRDRSPFKKSFKTYVELTSKTRYIKLAQQWGAILATAHARSDKDFNNSIPYSFDKQLDIITDKKHSEFRVLVRGIALNYADEVNDDYNEFKNNLLPNNCN